MLGQISIKQWLTSALLFGIYALIFFVLDRSEFGFFVSFAAFIFLLYAYITFSEEKNSFKFWLTVGISLRVFSLFYVPNLSDDIYRFIWDGNLMLKGMNPFEFVPDEIVKNHPELEMSDELYQKMNSRPHYTVYPPIAQFVFLISALISGQSVWLNSFVMKLFLLAAEIGSIYYLRKLLVMQKLDEKWSLLYILNPLIILELIGNLHFEGIMIFFLLIATYFMFREKYLAAFLLFAIAVNTKLVPLILVPYLAFSLGWKRTIQFGLIGVGTTFLLHVPFLSEAFIANFSKSLGLYFKTFEFNASIYYIVRWVGYQVKGYNIIATAGPYLATLSTLVIIGLSWFLRDKKLRNYGLAFILILSVYYLFSTTVHPWYISTMIAFVPFTGLLYPIVWSAMILTTYITYRTPNYDQNVTLIGFEYAVVLLTMILDYKKRKKV